MLKSHIVVDTPGLLCAIHIIYSNAMDRNATQSMGAFHLEDLPTISNFIVYGGFW